MLVVTRKEGEVVRIGDTIEVFVLRISSTKVRLGIRAPKEVRVLRGELEDLKCNGIIPPDGAPSASPVAS